jgi:hypothetical protein
MIYTKKASYSNTIFKRYPLKNAGGDNQLILESNYREDQYDISRILVGNPETISYSYDSMSLRLYVSNPDIKTGKDIIFKAHPIKQNWDPGIYLYRDGNFSDQ